MENASKALLIAAAVLIVVLLIAFGMGIFNKATDSGDPQATANTLKNGISNTTTAINSMIPSWTVTPVGP